ncbi:PREDICTED: uncharacterized protein LOC108800013 [Nanorana parkeri]|uniref:uncharacterized protein LOC108800013 n=1 Tax=Nanorana parkeri TaxID=125878 RepID=UPI0008548338|nr:PREDICTED: uncharacterized protein LOC108800013 [Nanorana parkeri]
MAASEPPRGLPPDDRVDLYLFRFMQNPAEGLSRLQRGLSLQLTAPSTHRAIMGEDVTIPCSFTIDNPPIDQKFLGISWYFQGNEILSVQNANVRSRDPRISYTGRAENGTADLSISDITITYGGIYRCAILYTPKKEEKEIRLDIQAPPQITITETLVVKNRESVLRSVISGFYPVDIDIKWLRDREILANVIMEIPQRDPDGTYSVRSSVTITPTEEDRERIFSCRVQHESLTAPLQEDFRLVYGEIPNVQITSQTFELDVEQSLVCNVSGFYPESITVNWFLNDTLLENAKLQRISSSAVESVYHFIPTEQNWGMELSCVVDHATLTTPHVERLLVQGIDLRAKHKTSVAIVAALLILVLGTVTFYVLYKKERKKSFPKVREITRSPGGLFSLDVDHFYPEAITVSWEVIQPPSSTQPRPIDSTPVMHQNQDGTFNVTSTSESLRGMIWEDEPYAVRASVTHQKLKRLSHKEWKSDDKDNRDFLAQPEVEMIKIPKWFVNQQTQLQCRITHFYPDQLTVNWFKKENGKEDLIYIVDNERYKIPNRKSQLQPDKTFTYTSLLEVTPSLEDRGSEIICRVSHPSLEGLIERTTGPLQVLVKPKAQHPIQLPINDSGDMVASFSLFSFYPEDIKVTWTYGPTQEKKPSQETISENPDGTFTVTSQRTIPGNTKDWPKLCIEIANTLWGLIHISPSSGLTKGERVSGVRWPGIGYHFVQDLPWRPHIGDFTCLLLDGKYEIMCEISGYFPDDLTVSWYKKNEGADDFVPVGNDNKYQTAVSEPQIQPDHTYSCTASLMFTPTLTEDQRSEFICRVQHPSMEEPIERRTDAIKEYTQPSVCIIS